MRLNQNDIDSIKQVIRSIDAQARIYLFGSRVDDSKRGGDIDLLVLSEKIDVVVENGLEKPFARIACEQGVEL